MRTGDQATSLTPAERVNPTWTDATARRASTAIGGPLGSHASVGRNRLWTALRVLLLIALVSLTMGWLAKSPCIQTGADGQLDQDGQRPWITGCYNDIVPLFGARGLNDPGNNPYSFTWTDEVADSDADADDSADAPAEQTPPKTHYLEYPALTGYFMWGAAALTAQYLHLTETTGLLPVPLDVGAYFTITAILLGLCYLLAVACTARIARRRIWDVAIMCAAPLVVVHAFTNWDLLAIGLTAAAMLAWSRTGATARSVKTALIWALAAGILIGLGTAAKLYPALLLGPLGILCLRAGKLKHFAATATAALAAYAAVNLPIALSYPQAWGEFFRMNTSRGPEWDSIYFLSTVIAPIDRWWSDENGQATALLNGLSLALFAIACAAIAYLALAAPRRPRFAQLAFLVVAAFLLTNKVFSPQYAIWLLPLVVLALPRWRPVIIWQLSEVAVWFLLMLSFSTDTGKNLSIHPFAVAAVIRHGLIIMLIVMVVREILRPATDLIRQAGDDDPSGGVLADAPDRVRIRTRTARHTVPEPLVN